jgi:hypothetical protein
MNVLRFLQEVDRRVLYALMIFVIAFPMIKLIELPVKVSPSTQSFYNNIEALNEGDFVVFGADWGAGTRGESRSQTIALVRHLMQKKLRFAFLAFEPQGKSLCQKIAEGLQKEYGYVEGVNWVNFGYKVDQENFLQGFVKDIVGTIKTDIHGNPLGTLPVMAGIKTAKDVDFLIDISGSRTYEVFITFMQQPYKDNLKMGGGLTAVMAPEAFNRLDSQQLVGLLGGLSGAAEYETLLKKPGEAMAASASSAFAHLLIIGFIILGNVAMFLEKRQRQRMGYGG